MTLENSSIKMNTFKSSHGSDTLKHILSSERLTVGVSAGIKGLSWQNNGRYEGFDIDLAKALSASIFCDKRSCEFIVVNPTERFRSVNSGEIDIGLFNASKTIQRELEGDVVFPVVALIDGEGVLVRKEDENRDFKTWNKPRIGIQTGTTSQQNINSYRNENQSIFYDFYTIAEAVGALKSSRIDAVVFDAIGLAGIRQGIDDENSLSILPEKISRELLGPVVKIDDPIFARIVTWVFHRLVLAADLGVSIDTLASQVGLSSKVFEFLEAGLPLYNGDPYARERLHTVISVVGNYNDIFDRNLGAASSLNLSPGLNSPTSTGGIYYAPPA